MRLENSFDVAAPLESVWEALLDVERVAPCLPGARIVEKTGEDAYRVEMRVKVGPISMQYRGEMEIAERDPEARRAVLQGQARESRGQGTARARVELRLSESGAGTRADMAADLHLGGRVAALGQGVLQDVSQGLARRFADNLAAMLSGPGPAAPVVPEEDGALPLLPLAAGVARERLRGRGALIASLAAAFLLGFLLGRC